MSSPLFITGPSLSPKNPVGVQTRLLLDEIPNWRHVYWDSADLHSYDPRSTRLESMPFSRVARFKMDPQSPLARRLAAAGLSWWREDSLKPAKCEWLRKKFSQDTSAVYAAVGDRRDAKRIRSLLSVIKRPFILHLWDILDDDQIAAPSFHWLIERAARVFCLSEAIAEEIARLRPDAAILRFRRVPSQFVATPPADGYLKVALIGNCRCYPDGVLLLNRALKIAVTKNPRIQVYYIGTAKRLEQLRLALDTQVTGLGFAQSDAVRDSLLSECHVGFLPGPAAPPASDMLSRYSIPSRILDYLATGLPILGAVHPASAAARYFRKLGLADCTDLSTPESIAERLVALSDTSKWSTFSELSKRGFREAQRESIDLNPWLDRVSTMGFLE